MITELSQHGLRLCGSFTPRAQDAVPTLPVDGAARVHLVGVAGSEFWRHFKASEQFLDGAPDPLDRWSRAIAQPLAQAWQGLALFPFEGPPYYPFQRWADRCAPTHRSRMMLRIHPEYGLWHAYRFALVLPAQKDIEPAADTCPAPVAGVDLCLQCDGQPCLRACPVNAYSGLSFAVDDCRGYLRTLEGRECMQGGCLARNACPVGERYRYESEHAAFHMQAFMPKPGIPSA